MIGLLLGALIIAQAASFFIFLDERRATVQSVERTQILERTASLIRLIESSPSALHDRIVQTASFSKLYFWISDASAVPHEASPNSSNLRERIHAVLGDSEAREFRVMLQSRTGILPWSGWSRPGSKPEIAHPVGSMAEAGPSTQGPGFNPPGLLISVRLADGRWLNAGIGTYALVSRWAVPTLISMTVAGGAICLIAVIVARRITRPLAKLAEAAEHAGRGDAIAPLIEAGPADVRQTIRAFNRMNDRLRRFVRDRTQMLAAINHDLRTLITSAQLRTELIGDEEARHRILALLDEMQQMTEATLVFARDESAAGSSRAVDLAALIDSLCEDLADAGMDVAFDETGRTPYACRPEGLRRAIRNLVENAVRYGYRARIRLEHSDGEFRIVICDDGPGIPQSDYERVFQPFVRLEDSRSRATGGIGLGMTIARSIVRAHGGDVSLAKSPNGKFCVTIHLPEFKSQAAEARWDSEARRPFPRRNGQEAD